MLSAFRSHIHKHLLFTKTDHLLVAVSGGVDSMVLCDLLLKNNYPFSVAHCNFKLRGAESDEDALFVKTYCETNKIKLFSTEFKTTEYAESKKISIQMAARELRYNFFDELIAIHHFPFILTAHHLNDNIETFFINLIRGSGINGLKGIEEKNGNRIRPLLQFTKEEIHDYAKTNNIVFRTDSSNEEEKYLRNQLRLNIIPKFKELNPSFEETMAKELELIQAYNTVITNHFEKEIKLAVQKTDDGIKINIEQLDRSSSPELLLFEILKDFSFNSTTITDIYESTKGIPGKLFSSRHYELVKDRDFLILNRITNNSSTETAIPKETSEITSPVHLKLDVVESFIKENNQAVAYVDAQKLVFPLNLRCWQMGDKFKPIGMTGFKKLSDLFIDLKLNQFEKKKTMVLENGNKEIIWVLNHRLDERYKVSAKTEKILRLELFGK